MFHSLIHVERTPLVYDWKAADFNEAHGKISSVRIPSTIITKNARMRPGIQAESLRQKADNKKEHRCECSFLASFVLLRGLRSRQIFCSRLPNSALRGSTSQQDGLLHGISLKCRYSITHIDT